MPFPYWLVISRSSHKLHHEAISNLFLPLVHQWGRGADVAIGLCGLVLSRLLGSLGAVSSVEGSVTLYLWFQFWSMIVICGWFCGPGGVNNGSCGNYVFFLACGGGGLLGCARGRELGGHALPSGVYPAGRLR